MNDARSVEVADLVTGDCVVHNGYERVPAHVVLGRRDDHTVAFVCGLLAGPCPQVVPYDDLLQLCEKCSGRLVNLRRFFR